MKIKTIDALLLVLLASNIFMNILSENLPAVAGWTSAIIFELYIIYKEW